MSTPQTRLGKALEIVLWIAALAVLAENISLFRENRHLREAAAPQIAAGTQLQMLSGLSLDGRVEPTDISTGFDPWILNISITATVSACDEPAQMSQAPRKQA